jgi:hypothetical protein
MAPPSRNATAIQAPTSAQGSIASDPPSYVPLSVSDPPSLAPTFGTGAQHCAEQENVYRKCLNSTMSLVKAGKCDKCVAASFPAPNNVCPFFQSSVCTALTRACDCGNCSTDIESYIDCALVEAGRKSCKLGCSYDTCDAVLFQFTSCMVETGFTDGQIAACMNCTRNALSNGGPVQSCKEATGRVCPAIATGCRCGKCRAQLETYMSCDTTGKEIPFNCAINCVGLASATDDGTGGTTPQFTSGVTVLSMRLSMAVLGLTLWFQADW